MQPGIRRWLGLAAIIALMGASGACRSGEETAGDVPPAPTTAEEVPAPDTGAPESKVPADQYVVVTIGEPQSLDPAWTYETAGAGVESNIYEGLVAFMKDQPDEHVPALAESWEVSDDGLTYTFNVRDGVTFHAGGTLEPSDIAYSMHRALLQDRADGPMWLFLEPILGVSSIRSYALDQAAVEESEQPLSDLPADTLAAVCENVKAAVTADNDAGTVTLTLATATPWMMQLLSQPWGGALDQEWMVEQGDWDGDCATWVDFHDPAAEGTPLFDAANGTGPFMLSKWEKGIEIVLEGNANYWRTEPAWDGAPTGPPALRRIVLQSVDEWGTRLAKLKAGEADTVNVPRANIDQVEAHVHSVYDGASDDIEPTVANPDGFLKLYQDFPLVSNTAAMFNFAMATEGGNQFIGSAALDGAGIPPDFFSDINVRRGFNYCFDWNQFIEDALKGEGVQIRGPIIDGLQGYSEDNFVYEFDLDKCEEELAQAWEGQLPETGFQMTIAYNAGNDARETVARILAENLAAVNENYKIEVVSLEWPAFLDERGKGTLPISVSGWLEDYHDASNWVHPYMHSAGAYARAQSFPEDLQSQFDDLIEQAAVETDDSVRSALYAELQNLANEHAIDIFLYQATGRFYVHRSVNGWYNNPLAPSTYYYTLSKSN